MYKMLIICILIVIFAIFSQIWLLKAVKFGFKISEKPEEAAVEPFFHVPEKKQPAKMTPEELRTIQILANVDRYVGSSIGQVKIERK